MKKRLGVAFILIVALIVGSEFLLPYLVSGLLAQAMGGLAGTDEINVQVLKEPAVAMFLGAFDRVIIHATNAKIDRITFNDLDIDLKKPQVDIGALLSQQTVIVKSVQDVDMTAVVTQEEVGNYLNQTIRGLKDAVVTVRGGKVQVSSNFIIGNIASIAITLEGKVAADDEGNLKFVTEKFMINNSVVGNIGGAAFSEIPLADLKKLPFGVTVKSVSMEDGKITITADNHPQ